MHPADIKASLIKAGFSLTKLAETEGVSQPLVTQVIYGRSNSKRIAAAISRITGQPLHRLWPSQYHDEAAKARTRAA